MGGEEIGVDAPWVLQDETEGGFPFAVSFWGRVDEAEELEEGPEDEAEEKGIAVCVSLSIGAQEVYLRCVSCQDEEAHGDEYVGRVLKWYLERRQRRSQDLDERHTMFASNNDIPELLNAETALKAPNHLSPLASSLIYSSPLTKD